MKIIEIINSLSGRAGAEVFFQQLCESLSKHEDLQLTVVSLWDSVDERIALDFKSAGINVETCHKKRRIDFQATKKLKEIILREKPDVIHTHLSVLPTYFLAFGVKKRKWALVHTIHNTAQSETTGLGKFIASLYAKRGQLIFVGISDRISKSIEMTYGTKSIATIYNGITLRFAETMDHQKQYDLVCVARFSEQKNHKLLFDACEAYYRKNHRFLKVLCLGKGDLFERYEKYVDGLKCSNYIEMKGAVDDVYPFLLKSKYFILTSTREGNPISILEALSCGVPVIATRVGGVPDVVKENEEGFLVESGNLPELLSALEEAMSISDQVRYSVLSDNCKKRAETFSIDSCCNQYINLFSSITK